MTDIIWIRLPGHSMWDDAHRLERGYMDRLNLWFPARHNPAYVGIHTSLEADLRRWIRDDIESLRLVRNIIQQHKENNSV